RNGRHRRADHREAIPVPGQAHAVFRAEGAARACSAPEGPKQGAVTARLASSLLRPAQAGIGGAKTADAARDPLYSPKQSRAGDGEPVKATPRSPHSPSASR